MTQDTTTTSTTDPAAAPIADQFGKPVDDPAGQPDEPFPTSSPAEGTTTPEQGDPAIVPAEPQEVFGGSFLKTVENIWNYKLFKVGEKDIEVSQLVIALIILIAGMIVAKVISKRVGSLSKKRLNLQLGAAAALQAISFYLLLVIVVFFALSIAGVPLTVFTIFGGALALGIGFGSQNIINNFISGLIVLIERPIAVGDLVTIDGEMGTVRKIAARATHVEDYLGALNIIPNSYILENRVTNWNKPTPSVRSKITIGVAYGSDTRLVRDLIEQAIGEHDRVVDNQPNQVLFTDFGDSALVFQAHFWTRPTSTLDKLTIESDVRYRIDELCREKGVSIPFPQRDTNLITDKPIEVRVRSQD